jgi:DCN1-like protein 1/2
VSEPLKVYPGQRLIPRIDPKAEEIETLTVDGTMKYLQALGVSLENAEMLVPLEIVQAPAMGEISKDGFVDGWKTIGYEFSPIRRWDD